MSSENKREDDWFIERYSKCQNRLYRFIASLVPNYSDAEELLQETSLRAWKLRDRYDRTRDMLPWLCAIARNLVHHYHRRNAMVRRLEPDVIDALLDRWVGLQNVASEREIALRACLGKLPETQKEFVHGLYANGESVKEFAESRGLSVQALYKKIQRIRVALLDCIRLRLASGET